jgi:hypothetical protein
MAQHSHQRDNTTRSATPHHAQSAQTATQTTRTPVEGRGVFKQTQLIYSRRPTSTMQRLPSLRRMTKMIYPSPPIPTLKLLSLVYLQSLVLLQGGAESAPLDRQVPILAHSCHLVHVQVYPRVLGQLEDLLHCLRRPGDVLISK